jgi:hypothetical protein
VGRGRKTQSDGAAWEGVHSLARAYRYGGEQKRMRRKRTDENRTGRGGSQSKMKMFCLEMLFFPAVTTSGRLFSVGAAREGRVHTVTRASPIATNQTVPLK